MQFTLIGNPENRRCQFFMAAAKSQGFAAPFVVSYLDLLRQKVDLSHFLSKSDALRIDSPGENMEVTRHFLQLGAEHPNLANAARISAKAAGQLVFEKGRIQFMRQQHLGFLLCLEQIEQHLAQYPALKVMNSIEGIRLMFDKIACHQHFQKQAISVVPAIYTVQNYDDLQQKMAQRGWNRVFIKPIHGSSASGVIAYRKKGVQEQAISSVELVHNQQQTKLYNSLKIRTYHKTKDIAYLINHLAKEGVIVEQWIPKASLPEGVFDLRMVVIGNKAQHTVVRQSQSPMTNLHLGNQRGNLDTVKAILGTDRWKSLCSLAEQALASLPNTLYAGLDVMLSNTLKKSYILEANAFGDLLPNVLVKGKDTYSMALSSMKEWQ
ncbi:STM4014 family protein [Aureispira anguillae]|uniref:STM4014 family protein n=1 Tax=Aureispira anguillae TaxID=2864201 RepID=A0A915YI03_9BACT|nr:STM4014 family protein [Aureispira anguillae]BDS13263.1 STM4014 family protein [Aureispira anguillae]